MHGVRRGRQRLLQRKRANRPKDRRRQPFARQPLALDFSCGARRTRAQENHRGDRQDQRRDRQPPIAGEENGSRRDEHRPGADEIDERPRHELSDRLDVVEQDRLERPRRCLGDVA